MKKPFSYRCVICGLAMKRFEVAWKIEISTDHTARVFFAHWIHNPDADDAGDDRISSVLPQK